MTWYMKLGQGASIHVYEMARYFKCAIANRGRAFDMLKLSDP